jgi:hypothetical protein
MGLAAKAHVMEPAYYCEDCHCIWPHDPVPNKPRSHGAPYYFIEGVQHNREEIHDSRQ